MLIALFWRWLTMRLHISFTLLSAFWILSSEFGTLSWNWGHKASYDVVKQLLLKWSLWELNQIRLHLEMELGSSLVCWRKTKTIWKMNGFFSRCIWLKIGLFGVKKTNCASCRRRWNSILENEKLDIFTTCSQVSLVWAEKYHPLIYEELRLLELLAVLDFFAEK